MSIREKILDLLMNADEPMSVDDIARELGLDPRESKEIYRHLEHVARTARGKYGMTLLMEPPVCRKCGYIFKDLRKPRKPSKCPKCGSQWIEPPRFIIRR